MSYKMNVALKCMILGSSYGEVAKVPEPVRSRRGHREHRLSHMPGFAKKKKSLSQKRRRYSLT